MLYDDFNKQLYREDNTQPTDKTRKIISQKDLIYPLGKGENIEPEEIDPGQTISNLEVVEGAIQSKDYNASTGVGWKIKPKQKTSSEGAEFGDVKIGHRQITIVPGENIQAAIDKANTTGGGRIIIKNGTHSLTSDLTLYSNVYLQGENAGSTILDFQTNAYGIKVVGSNTYTTGTISISNNTTTVTGSGTSWTSDMVGRSIMLNGGWYPIAAVSSSTSLTIAVPYAEEDIPAGTTYIIATTKNDVKITDLTIKNASSGIKGQYTNELFIKDVEVQTSVTGIELVDLAQCNIDQLDMTACNTGYSFSNAHFWILNSCGSVDAQANHGLVLNNCTSFSVNGSFFMNSAGDGINATDCDNGSITATTCIENGGQGIEFVSGNTSMSLVGNSYKNNASDGMKLTGTTDNLQIIGSFFKNNGGYGVNIAASDCDDNNITGNTFTGNTSGAVNDSGTGTIVQGNSPEYVNSPRIVGQFRAGEDLTKGDAVYADTVTDFNLIPNDTNSIQLLASSSQFLTAVDSVSLSITGDITISLYVYPTFSPSDGTKYPILNKEGAYGIAYYRNKALDGSLTALEFVINVTGSNTADYLRTPQISSDTLPQNTWSHISITRNKTTGDTNIYINGVNKASGIVSAGTAITDNTNSLYLGGNNFVFTNGGYFTIGYFDGLLDNGRIWNIERTSIEINNDMNKELTGTETGLQANWQFDGDLLDNTSNNNDLTNNGGATFSTNVPVFSDTGLLKTDPTTSGKYEAFLGFVKETVSKQDYTNLIVSGIVSGFSGLTQGSQYYLSDTAGQISTTPGTNTRKVGIAISSTELLITNIW